MKIEFNKNKISSFLKQFVNAANLIAICKFLHTYKVSYLG